MTRSRIISLLLIIAMTGGCASTSSAPISRHYYVLDDLPTKSANDAERLIRLARVSVPDYLNQSNLVMRQADQKITIANYHHWAEGLPKSIHRVLRNKVNSDIGTYRLVSQCRDCGELKIEIEHFYPTESGDVHLAGSFILDRGTTAKTVYQSFAYKEQMNSEGYAESVRSMQRLLERLALDLIAQLDD